MVSKEISMSFKKVDRSYKTPQGWRLATFQEVKSNFESIKQQGLLKGRDRVRLLDGWIGGPDYNFKMENTFRAYMGFMLVIQVHTETDISFGDSGKELYQGVNLSEEGKQVGLFLCAYDWNYEVVYWLLNSLDKTQTMDPRDVRDGRIPVNNETVVKETVRLNNLINGLARKYGETFVDYETRKRKLTLHLVREVLRDLGTSVLEKFPKADREFLDRTFQRCMEFYDNTDYWFEGLESYRDSAWNLIWDHFCTLHVAVSTYRSLPIVINKLLKDERAQVTTSQRNFTLSSSILYYITGLHSYFLYKREHDSLEKFITITCDENFNVLDQIVHVALREGDVIITKKMLECGAHASSQNLKKQTALHVAFDSVANEGETEVVKILLDKCDAKEQLANSPDGGGKTALHLASSKGNAKMCRLLLDYGAKPDAKDNKGQLPLHYAVEKEKDEAIEVVKTLLDRCAAKEQLVNSPDEEGKTVLHLASSKGNAKMCRLLLDYGAKPDDKDNNGQLPLHYAVEENVNECIEVVKILLDRCDAKEPLVNSPEEEEGKTALHLASSNGNAKMCRLLLDSGAKPDVKDNGGRLPLHYAVERWKNGAIDVVKILLDRCDAKEQLVNSPDEGGKTFLHLASSNGNEKICRLLLDYGAKPDAKDSRGRVPLHYAVEEEEDEAIDVLINVSDQVSIEMLNIADGEGKSPSDIAADQNNIKLMAKFFPILKQPPESYLKKVDTSKLLRQFASEGNIDIVGKLLERGASPLDVDEEGKTALHHAAMCKDEIIDLILEKCQDKKKLISMCDKKGKTAVHVAAFNGNLSLEFKDSIDIKDRDGRSPLYDATQRKLDGRYIIQSIINMMERKGISLDNLIDTTGLTPLHVAASRGKVFQVDELLKRSGHPKKYVKRADYLGQTALHKAAKGGHEDTIKVLLHWGAQPLLERDCDGRTALHYAVQTQTGDDGIALAKLLLKKCGSKERQLLFLWASAAGLGTADQKLGDCDPLKTFLSDKKKELTKETINLLQTAARVGDTEMTKELLTRGYQIADIQHDDWIESLPEEEKVKVNKVLKEIKTIAEQGNDRPSLSDNLGRDDFARSLAALLLNPYLEPPIAIGISGNWGMGKSSLMLQTEIILLKTAAQSALLPTSKSPSSNLPGVQEFELSKVGQKRYNKIKRWIRALTKKKSKESQGKQPEDSLDKFLNNYEREYHKIFKSLAAIDSSDMFIPKDQQSHSRSDSPSEGSVPAIITVQYNAWKYRNESEALAGMAVEITKEMEEIMTDPQWLSTCWRNTWRKQRQTIWIEFIFPCLLAIFLAGTFTWLVWLLLDRYNVKEGVELKYASLPVTIIITVWTLVKSVMSTLNPVSTQLMNYIKFPDHTDNLGYQERVISDIKFLKGEIRRKPYFLCTAASCISYLCPKFFRETIPNSKAASTSTSYASDIPRIIVFVDDLDRCQESVILQVLSAINLVLAVCEISAIVGMDKALIQRAIIKEFGDKSLENGKELEDKSLQNNKELADKYLQKIIQLPLDLPDPSEDESESFLTRQLGVFSKQLKDEDGEPETYEHDDSKSEIDAYYNALFTDKDEIETIRRLGDRLKEMFNADTSTPDTTNVITQMERDSRPQTDASDRVAIDVTNGNEGNTKSCGEQKCLKLCKFPIKNVKHALRRLWNALQAFYIESAHTGDKISSESIPMREMMFVRYSVGEQEAFCYFRKMATDWRKLPRQWKCLLYYHRLVWYIFSMSNKARNLDGWQVQLITWIFICWEWEENINILIQNWDRIGILKAYKSESESSGPSLRAIVEHYIENEVKDKKMSDIGDDKHKAKVSERSESKELLEHSKNKDTPSEKLEGGMKDKDDSNNAMNHDESSNKVVDKLKEVVKDQMITGTDAESNNRAISEKLEDIVKRLMEHEKDIRDLKETKQQTGEIKKSDEEEKTRRNNWRKMKAALKRYDVSMKGIQGFQRFRFYCVAGYLPWPLSKEETEDS